MLYSSESVLKSSWENKDLNPGDGRLFINDPATLDVLCGKEKKWAEHPGNQLYRSKIILHAREYQAANKVMKMNLTRMIVNSMHEHNARFLRLVESSTSSGTNRTKGSVTESYKVSIAGGVWEVISDQLARDKTSHALRFAARTFDVNEVTSRSNSPNIDQFSGREQHRNGRKRASGSSYAPKDNGILEKTPIKIENSPTITSSKRISHSSCQTQHKRTKTSDCSTEYSPSEYCPVNYHSSSPATQPRFTVSSVSDLEQSFLVRQQAILDKMMSENRKGSAA
jgi:hypothetical protein